MFEPHPRLLPCVGPCALLRFAAGGLEDEGGAVGCAEKVWAPANADTSTNTDRAVTRETALNINLPESGVSVSLASRVPESRVTAVVRWRSEEPGCWRLMLLVRTSIPFCGNNHSR